MPYYDFEGGDCPPDVGHEREHVNRQKVWEFIKILNRLTEGSDGHQVQVGSMANACRLAFEATNPELTFGEREEAFKKFAALITPR